MSTMKKVAVGALSTMFALNVSAQQSSCDGVADYNSASAYSGGAQVVDDGGLYKANWWVQGTDPSENSGPVGSGKPWTYLGQCGSAQVDPEIEIISPSNGLQFTQLNVPPYMNVDVDVNDEDVAIDSVQFVIVDLLCGNASGCAESRRFTTFPNNFDLGSFQVNSNAIYTEIYAKAFSNGQASVEKSVTFYVDQTPTPEPTIEITSPTPNQEFLFPDITAPMVHVSVDVNSEETRIDSVRYVIVDLMCHQSGCAEVSRRTMDRTAQTFNLLLVGNTDAIYTEVYATAFSNGRASAEKSVLFYVDDYEHPRIHSMVYPENGSTITASGDSLEQIIIDFEAKGDVYGVEYKVTDGAGVFNYQSMDGNVDMPYTLRAEGPVTIEAKAIDSMGVVTWGSNFSFNVEFEQQEVETSVSMVSPVNGDTLNAKSILGETTPITFAASEDVSHMRFSVNCPLGILEYSDMEAPFSFNYPLAARAEGNVTVTAVAFNAQNQMIAQENFSFVTYWTHSIKMVQPFDRSNVEGVDGQAITVAFDVKGSTSGVEYKVTDAAGVFNFQNMFAPYSMTYHLRAEGVVKIEATSFDTDGSIAATGTYYFNVIFPAAECSAPAWDASTAYTGGEVVSHNGEEFKAKWWNTDEPSVSAQYGPWEHLGACGSSAARLAVDAASVEAYPNPVADQLNINGAEAFETYEIVDLVGNVIASGSLEAGSAVVSTDALSQGVYQVVLKGENVHTFQVVK